MLRPIDTLVGNIPLCIFCIALILFIIILNTRHLFSSNVSYKVGTGYFILWIVFTFYCCFNCPPEGDNFSSMNNYYSYLEGVDKAYLHFEPIYFWLMDLFSFGYVAWRFAVWGLLGATSYVLLSKWLNLDKHISTIVCFTFALPILLYYQRAACGYCLLYMAMAVYLNNPMGYTKLMKFIVALLLALLSLLFHTAMPFYLLLLLLSLLIPLNKGSIPFIILFSVIVNFSLSKYSLVFLDLMSESTQETGLRYLENASILEKNISGVIFEFLNKLPVYFMVIYGVLQQLRNKILLSKVEKTLLLNALLLLLLSFMYNDLSTVFDAKFYKASMLPFTLFLASYFPKIRKTKIAKLYVIGTALTIAFIAYYKISRGVFFYAA